MATLRALVDWSYDILSEEEQTVLRRLSVFVGGFDMPAAEEVCGAEPLNIGDVLDLVSCLVEKSLVMTKESKEGTRYRMLETIRDYAREKLEQSGELAPMQAFWVLRGYCTEGRTFVRAALSLPAVQASDLAQAWGLYVGAALAESQSDHAEALRMLKSCLELRRGLGNPYDIAATLSTLSLARLQAGDAEGAGSWPRQVHRRAAPWNPSPQRHRVSACACAHSPVRRPRPSTRT